MDKIKLARLLRPAEVVDMTGFSRAKVYAMAKSGEIPSIRSGRSVRVPLAALELWIERNTTGGAAAPEPVKQSVYEKRGPIIA